MHYLSYALVAFSLWQTGNAARDSNGNSILEPISDPNLLNREAEPERSTTILKPILPSEMGLQRRAGPVVGLHNDTSLFWGGATDGQNIIVNVTLDTGETQMILSMDNFKGELKSVTCENSLSLTFTSDQTYQEAIDDWEWVNFNEQRTFVMIVNYGDCAPDSGRQPWVVSGATYDNANFRVHFTAVQTAWNDLNNPYTLEWGAYTPPASPAMAARGFLDGLLPSTEVNPKFDVSLAHSIPSSLFEKTTTSGLTFTIGCDSCGTTGSLTIAGKLKGTLLKLSIDEAYIEAIPHDIGADFNPSFTIAGQLGAGWTKSWDIAKIPLSQFNIPGVFNVGPELRLSAGFELSGIQGSATVRTGVSARIPDSATAKVDFHGKDSHIDGWKPKVTTKPLSADAQVQGTLAVFTAVGVDLGMTVFKVIDMGVGIQMQVPKLTMTLGAEFNSLGNVCPNRPEMFGLKFDASIGVDLSIQGWNGDKDKPFFEKDLWNEPALYSFPQVCLPFGSPPNSPISLTKSVSVTPSTSSTSAAQEPTSVSTTAGSTETSTTGESELSTTNKPTESESPTTTKEPSTNDKPTTTDEPTTSGKPTTSEKPSTVLPTGNNTTISKGTTTEPLTQQPTIIVPPTSAGNATSGGPTVLSTSISNGTTIGPIKTLPVGTGIPISTGTGGTTSGLSPIYANQTGIWTIKPSIQTSPIIDYFPTPSGNPSNNPPTSVITNIFPQPTGGPNQPTLVVNPTVVAPPNNQPPEMVVSTATVIPLPQITSADSGNSPVHENHPGNTPVTFTANDNNNYQPNSNSENQGNTGNSVEHPAPIISPPQTTTLPAGPQDSQPHHTQTGKPAYPYLPPYGHLPGNYNSTAVAKNTTTTYEAPKFKGRLARHVV